MSWCQPVLRLRIGVRHPVLGMYSVKVTLSTRLKHFHRVFGSICISVLCLIPSPELTHSASCFSFAT
jgi:hypothetical protein